MLRTIRIAWLIAATGSLLLALVACRETAGTTDPSDAPSIATFTAEPATLPPGGGTATLRWEVAGARSLVIDPGVGDVTSRMSVEVAVEETTGYTLTATGTGGSATAQTTVAVEPSGSPSPPPESEPSSAEKIDEARRSGEIDDIDALRYLVFAAYGDERLPVRFHSAAPIHPTPIGERLFARLDSLPADVQDELRPFALSPAHPDSWYQRQRRDELEVHQIGGLDDFAKEPALDGRAWVWYPNGESNTDELKTMAEVIARDLDAVYGEVARYMKREPLFDGEVADNHGDDRLDVFVIDDPGTWDGWARPYMPQPPTVGERRAGYLLMNRRQISEGGVGQLANLKVALAHELMHLVQWNYATVSPWSEGSWLRESTATWFEHKAYPDYDSEHKQIDGLMDDPHLSLTTTNGAHEYGSYLYWFYLTHRFGNDDLPRLAFERAESEAFRDAVDAITPGGFVETFADFAIQNLNEPPFDDYREFEATLGDSDSHRVAVTFDFQAGNLDEGEVQKSTEFEFELGGTTHLSAQYVRYDLTQGDFENEGTILFANGYSFALQRGGVSELLGRELPLADETFYATELPDGVGERQQVKVLVKRNGAWRAQPYDLTDIAFAWFCQENPSERIEEMIVIFVNAEHREGKRHIFVPNGKPPTLFASNVACGDWGGSARVVHRESKSNRSMNYTLDLQGVRFARPPSTVDALLSGAGQSELRRSVEGPSFFYPSNGFSLDPTVTPYRLAEVDRAQWEFHQTITRPSETCRRDGSGSLDLKAFQQASFSLRPTITGTRGSGQSLWRSYGVAIGATTFPDTPITGSCTTTGAMEPLPFSGLIEGGGRDTPIGEDFLLGDDGRTIEKEWTIEDIDGTDWEIIEFDLDLEPVRRP